MDKPVEEDISDDVGDDVGDDVSAVEEGVGDDVGDDVGATEPTTKEDKVLVIEEESESDKGDGKSTNVTLPVPNVDLLGGGKQLKKIVINPNYVAADA